MLLSDSMIKTLIARNVLANASEENIGPVSYDLTTDYFYSKSVGSKATSVTLAPGDSVFVASKERLSLSNDLAARVLLRNSRIRQGLSLDAPLYFPGHETVIFFRVTNVSADEITLDCSKGIAQIVFEQVCGEVEQPYSGGFNKEVDFRGMGNYEKIYSEDIKKITDKADEIKGIERRMYEGVLALMAIFAAIFTLVNINAGVLSKEFSYLMVVVVNLVIVGAFSLLVGLIAWVMGTEKRWWIVIPLGIGLAAFLFAANLASQGVSVS